MEGGCTKGGRGVKSLKDMGRSQGARGGAVLGMSEGPSEGYGGFFQDLFKCA